MKKKPEPVVKYIQPSRLRWFMHELRAAGVPFKVSKEGGQYKVRIADPRAIETYNRIADYKARQRRRGDVLGTIAKWLK